MQLRRHSIAAVCTFLLLAPALSSAQVKPPNLDFNVEQCDDSTLSSYTGPVADKGAWVKGGVTAKDKFVTKVRVEINCTSEAIADPGYEVSGKQLTLLFTVVTKKTGQYGPPPAACHCAVNLNYAIADLPMGDYKINVQQFNRTEDVSSRYPKPATGPMQPR